jgi:hypothetical protein
VNAERVFSVEDCGRKYRVETWLWFALGATILGFGGFFLMLKLMSRHIRAPLYPPNLFFDLFFFLLTYGPFVIAPVVVFLAVSRTREETRLYESTRGSELIVSDTNLRVSIALFEGEERRNLRAAARPYFEADWTEIASFTVDPARYKAGQRATSPPYYIIALQGSRRDKVYILRGGFFGRERELLELIQQRLSSPIVYNDPPR